MSEGRASAIADVLGDEVAPPAGWPYDLEAPQQTTGLVRPQPAPDTRIAAMFAITTFTLGSEHTGLRVLELRLKYRDGCVVWLNGIEVARKPKGELPTDGVVGLRINHELDVLVQNLTVNPDGTK